MEALERSVTLSLNKEKYRISGRSLILILIYWLSEVIKERLNNDSKKSWQKLATALKQCGYSVMAEKIDPQGGDR